MKYKLLLLLTLALFCVSAVFATAPTNYNGGFNLTSVTGNNASATPLVLGNPTYGSFAVNEYGRTVYVQNVSPTSVFGDLQIANALSLTGTSTKSMSVWAKASNTNYITTAQSILEHVSTTNDAAFRIQMNRNSTHTLITAIQSGGNTINASVAYTTAQFSPNTWHLYAATLSAATCEVKLYVDNALVNTSAIGSACTATAGYVDKTYVGGSYLLASNAPFNGSLSGAYVYNYVLSLQNVSETFADYSNTYLYSPVTQQYFISNFTIYARNFFTNSSLSSYSAVVSQGNNTLQYSPFSSMSAWYTFDQNNQTAPDSSGNGNTGTLNGWTFNNLKVTNTLFNASGKYGTALTFSGVSSQGDPVINSSLTNVTGRSIFVWIKPNNATGDTKFVAHRYDGYVLGWNNNRFQCETAGSFVFQSLSINSWHYVGFTQNGTTAICYADGVNFANITGTNSYSNNPLSLGYDVTFGRNYNGSMDEFRKWNVSLNASQIAQEMNSAYPVNGNGLVASYSFESNFTNATGKYTYDTNNLVAGQINGSFTFDGANDQINIASSLGFATTNSITQCSWNKFSTPPTANQKLWQSPVNRFDINVEGTSGKYFGFIWDGTTSQLVAKPSSNYADSQWHHTCLVANTTHVIMFVDGATVGSVAYDGSFGALRNPNKIGSDASSDYFNGSIDDVRIYNSSLSASDVYQLYQAGAYRIYNYSTTNGVIDTKLLNISGAYNVTVSSSESPGYYSETYSDYNSYSVLNAILQPYFITDRLFYAKDYYTSLNLTNFSITDGITTASTTSGVINATLSNSYNQFGIYNINYSSTENGGYFNLSLLNVNVTSTINTNLSQSIVGFYAVEKVSNSVLSGVNFSTPYLTNTTHYMRVQNYNVTASKSGYFNKTVSYTPTALTSSSQNISYMTATRASITVRNRITNATISNYNVTFNNSAYSYTETQSTTNGTVNADLIAGTWTMSVQSDGYSTNTSEYVLSTGTNSIIVYVYTTNSILFSVYDELTKSLITGTNVTIQLIGTYDSYDVNTTNGTWYKDLITPDSYVIRYFAPGYNTRFSYINLVNGSANPINLYLLNQSLSSNITITLYDQDRSIVGNALIKVLKYSITTNTYSIVNEVFTDNDGNAYFDAQMDTEYYKFIVEYPVGTVVLMTEPAYIHSTSITLQYLETTSGTSIFNTIYGIDTLFVFNSATNSFRLDYTDNSNRITQACMYVYQTNNNGALVNQSCLSATTGSILIPVTNTTGSMYQADVYYTLNGEQQYAATQVADFRDKTDFGLLGLMIVTFITMAVVLIFRESPKLSVLIAPIPLVLACVAGFVVLEWWIPASLVALSFVIVYLISRWS